MFIDAFVSVLGVFAAYLFVSLFLFLIIAGPLFIPGLFKEWRCKHAEHDFRENMACDAICCNCGKNLGFIGRIREQRSKKNV